MKKIIIIFIGLIIFLGFSDNSIFADPRMSELIMDGKLDEAKEMLDKASERGLSENTALYYQGLLEPEGHQSAQYLKESLYGGDYFPEKDLAAIKLAHYYFIRSFYITCIGQLESFPEQNKYSNMKDESQWLLGMTYLNSGKYDKAKATFRNIIEEYSDSEFVEWAFWGLGLAYYKTGDYNRATGSFTKVMEKSSHPAYPQAMAMLALSYESLGYMARAKKYKDEYFEKYPAGFYGDVLPAITEISDGIPDITEEDTYADELVGANYYIQVGAFSSKNNANRMKNRLEKEGYRAEVEKQVVNRQRYYKVLVGPYTARIKAEAAKKRLESQEKDSFLIILK
ncbi:MAG: tetratricopeptide repeat protein [candidate division Zixibacteria bacterium]|nr:tetratricopeptide repeat protein [candidate division Zixibacteria bacterium]